MPKPSRGVGYVGLVLGAASGAKSIYDACSVDGSGECGRITTREVVGFIGGDGDGVYFLYEKSVELSEYIEEELL